MVVNMVPKWTWTTFSLRCLEWVWDPAKLPPDREEEAGNEEGRMLCRIIRSPSRICTRAKQHEPTSHERYYAHLVKGIDLHIKL
jgi:hypothetical protein